MGPPPLDNFDRLDAGEWETVVDPTDTPMPPDGSQLVSRPIVENPGPYPKQMTPEAEAAREHACDVLKSSEMSKLMRKVKAVQRAILDLRSAGGMALLLLDSCRRKIFRIGSGPFDSSCHHTTAAAPSTAGQIMTTKTFQRMAGKSPLPRMHAGMRKLDINTESLDMQHSQA